EVTMGKPVLDNKENTEAEAPSRFKRHRLNILYIVIAIWGIVFLREAWVQNSQVTFLAYNEFQEALEAGQVEKVSISDNHIRGEFKESAKKEKAEFMTARVEPELAQELEQ